MSQTPAKPIRALRRRRGRQGFTLIEAVMSMLVVGLMLVAALNTIGASKVSSARSAEQSIGPMLAQELMTEILSQAYQEPVDTVKFGRESESGGDRAEWDDVDDYDGWSASPPEIKEGAEIPGLTGWERQVTVRWVNPINFVGVGSDTGIKRIDVQALYQGRVVAELSALRTVAWPDSTETPGGNALAILFVVADPGAPIVQEISRQVLMKSWGFDVKLINAAAPLSAFDAAAGRNDVAYVSATVDDIELGTKLRDATIGVVNERVNLIQEFGFAGDFLIKSRDEFKVLDDSHYITTFFGSTGYHQLFTSLQPLSMANNPLAPDLIVLAESFNTGGENNNKPSLLVLETGAGLYGGGNAAGRRVQLPWGQANMDINALTDDGRTLMKRSIEWAASMEQP